MYPTATSIIQDVITTAPGGHAATGSALLNMLTGDQQITEVPPKEQDVFVMFNGRQVLTGYRWPIGISINVDDKAALKQLWEDTGAVAAAALLFVYHKEHKLFDYIPGFITVPSFMNAHGDALKKVMRASMSPKSRKDIKYHYYRLLQQHPIMFDTVHWLTEATRASIALQMLKYGFPNLIAYIPREDLTAELMYESIKKAKELEGNRVVPPSVHHYLMMYDVLLQLDGAHLLSAEELVSLGKMSWVLTLRYITAKETPFNEAFSILLSVMHGSSRTTPTQNYELIRNLYDKYGPSPQWPALDNVIKHAIAVIGWKVEVPTPAQTTIQGLGSSSSLSQAAATRTMFD